MVLPSGCDHSDQLVIRPQKPYLLFLPSELLIEIFSYLPYPSLAFLRKAHTRFDRLFSTTELLPNPVGNISPRAFPPHGHMGMTPHGGNPVSVPPTGRQLFVYTAQGVLPGVKEVLANVDSFGQAER